MSKKIYSNAHNIKDAKDKNSKDLYNMIIMLEDNY